MRLAALALLAGVVRHLLWEHTQQQALAWNLFGAVAVLSLLGIIWQQNRGAILGSVLAWFAYEESLVGICSAWRMVDWWPVLHGQEQCSARIEVNIGAASLVAIGALASVIAMETRGKHD